MRLRKRETLHERKGRQEQESVDLRAGSIFSDAAIAGMGLTGFEDESTKRLVAANHYLRSGKVATLRPILPALLAIKGEPYTLTNYFPFEPFFRTRMPHSVLLKTGRQVSKSRPLLAEERVYAHNGRPLKPNELHQGMRVLALDANLRWTSQRISGRHDNPPEPVMRVHTRMGSVFGISATHELRTLQGFSPLDRIGVGGRIAALRRGGDFDNQPCDRSRMIVTAYLIGDGCCGTSNYIELTNDCTEVLDEFLEAAPDPVIFRRAARGSARRCRVGLTGCIAGWLREDGLLGKYAWEKRLPAWVFDLSKADTLMFLSRLWATDGMIKNDKTKPQIAYSTTSYDLSRDVRALLTKLGIPASVKQRKAGYCKGDVYVPCRDCYVVRVETRQGWQTFLDNVKVPGKPPFVLRDVQENNNRDTVPIEVNDWIAELAGECRGTDGPALLHAGLRKKAKYPLTYAKLAAYVKFFQQHRPNHSRLQDLETILNGDVLWDEIVSIEQAGVQPTWDIEVEGEHNYVLDGVVSHNSTSLAAQGIIFSNSIPYFSTLYVTPLFEMTRRFSHNYVRLFIETSPVKRLFMGSRTINQILQRSFRNGSSMQFSFAFQDAERTRGIPADKVVIDESIRIGTMIGTPFGSRAVETFSAGDAVLAFDESGNVKQDEVLACSDHGIRDCYRFEFSNGAILEATSDSWIATTVGWKRVETIITELGARADATWHDAGRRQYELQDQESCIPQFPWLQAAPIQLPQVPGLVRVRTHAAQEDEERRLRDLVQSLANSQLAGTLAYRFLVSLRRQEVRDTGVVEPLDLGGDRLVVHGRRRSLRADSGIQHTGLQRWRSLTSPRLARLAGSGCAQGQSAQPAQSGQVLPGDPAHGRSNLQLGGPDPLLRLPGNGVQASVAGSSGNIDLLLVSAGVLPGNKGTTSLLASDKNAERLLRSIEVPTYAAPRSKQTVHGQTWPAGGQELTAARNTQGQPRSRTKTRTRENGSAARCRPGALSQLQERMARETSSPAPASGDRLRELPNQVFDSSACQGPLLLTDMPKGSLRSKQAELRLEEAKLVRVTWTGKHRVFDLETRFYNTFFANGVAVHNCQDMNHDFLQIIYETLSGSDWGLKQSAGTPKSLDNTMEKLWTDSSQAEWVIKCPYPGCGHWNVPALSHDLLGMIGPWHRNISEKYPGTVCAKCSTSTRPRPINPRTGRWIHTYKERRWTNAGYHVPQIIMPMHAANPDKWDILVGKSQGRGNTAANVFFNEVCGESYDLGAKLVTQTDLKFACSLPWRNTVEEAEKHLDQYLYRILAVDWGGGGGRLSNSNTKKAGEQRERTSFTVLSVLGMRPDGKIDVIWGYRSLRTHDHFYEAKLCIAAMRRFRCSHFAHDYNGAGAIREALIRQAGIPLPNIVAIAYHPAATKNIVNLHPATDDHPRDWYSCDKSRSLQLTCEMLKCGLLRFFAYDYVNADDAGLMHDFLALIEEKVQTRLASDIHVITKNPNLTDDFAQATNIGVMALCYMSGNWPDLAMARDLTIPLSMIEHLQPSRMPDWNDLFD